MKPEQLLTEQEAAEVLQISPATLRKWRCIGRGPKARRIGRAVRYKPSDLAEYIEHAG